jgi:hypothetical protein
VYFDPEDLINRCYCEQEFFWLYLHENFWEFYEDLHDMNEFLDYCVVADRADGFRFKGFWGKDSALPSYLVARAVMDCNTHPSQFKSLYAMKAPLVNALRDKINTFGEDVRFESASFGVSKQCFLAELRYGNLDAKVVPQEADEDFLWKEIGLGVESISFG